MGDIASLRRILKSSRTIAVVGLSDQWYRPSHFVAKYLQQHGYRIFPVNPRLAGTTLLGEPVVASVLDLKQPVDMVDVFRRSADMLPIAEQAIQIGARVLWQQIGVVNRQADALVRAAGLDSVMDRCVKIGHQPSLTQGRFLESHWSCARNRGRAALTRMSRTARAAFAWRAARQRRVDR